MARRKLCAYCGQKDYFQHWCKRDDMKFKIGDKVIVKDTYPWNNGTPEPDWQGEILAHTYGWGGPAYYIGVNGVMRNIQYDWALELKEAATNEQ